MRSTCRTYSQGFLEHLQIRSTLQAEADGDADAETCGLCGPKVKDTLSSMYLSFSLGFLGILYLDGKWEWTFFVWEGEEYKSISALDSMCNLSHRTHSRTMHLPAGLCVFLCVCDVCQTAFQLLSEHLSQPWQVEFGLKAFPEPSPNGNGNGNENWYGTDFCLPWTLIKVNSEH